MKPMRGCHHGTGAFQRGLEAPHSCYFASGTFGRLFPTLPPLSLPGVSDDELQNRLRTLGESAGPMHPTSAGGDPLNPGIDAGYVFLGQFIDHDITLDTTSSLERQTDPEGLRNFRTPVLELDSVYGLGPEATPYLYDGDKKLLVEPDFGRDQLPRTSARVAIIGDPRNDENLVISQLQLAFVRFHNKVVDILAANGVSDELLFEEAQRIVRWHYQWIIVNEFLPLTVGRKLVERIYKQDCCSTGRCFFHWRNAPFIPVEFAGAAYRFGHSQVPGHLQVNDDFKVGGDPKIVFFDPNEVGDLDPDDLSGFRPPAPRRYVDWKYLFATGAGAEQPSQKIDRVLSEPLFTLPFIASPGPFNPASLAARNLLRGHSLGLPSGQAIARAMCIEPLDPADLAEVQPLGFDKETPLFYYVLKEAQVVEGGSRLGPVGGTIVTEVLVGLLEGDRRSFVRTYPKWTPEKEVIGTTSSFGIKDLVTFETAP